ncbi:MAG: hypothetical protein K0S26_1844 [Bacteroidota bacterium]|nr:hypothetical protein [Bacteroidota bacterium]
MQDVGVPLRAGLFAASPRYSCLVAVGFPLQSLTLATLKRCARDASENPFACLLQKIVTTARFLLASYRNAPKNSN